MVEELGADVCDINMGCPANKVLKGCAGARADGRPRPGREIIVAVRRAITIPLTVKFRARPRRRSAQLPRAGRVCEANGVAAVAMHARTARQMFGGEADWSQHRAPQGDALDPGDRQRRRRDAEDAVRMLRQTGCDGVMIGRGATKNPWIFRQTAALLSGGARYRADARTIGATLILQHFRCWRARAVGLRAPQAAQVHRLVHPRPAQRPAPAPAHQRSSRRLAFLAAVEDSSASSRSSRRPRADPCTCRSRSASTRSGWRSAASGRSPPWLGRRRPGGPTSSRPATAAAPPSLTPDTGARARSPTPGTGGLHAHASTWSPSHQAPKPQSDPGTRASIPDPRHPSLIRPPSRPPIRHLPPRRDSTPAPDPEPTAAPEVSRRP